MAGPKRIAEQESGNERRMSDDVAQEGWVVVSTSCLEPVRNAAAQDGR